MKDNNFIGYNSLLDVLPEKISGLLRVQSEKTKRETTEIRLRLGRPLSLSNGFNEVFISENGMPCYLNQNGLFKIDKVDIDECFVRLCNHSVYAYETELKSGYIPLEHGNRAGVCGTAVYRNGKLKNFKDISSINIRIAKQIYGVSNQISQHISDGGILIVGAPGTGKTTVLRDLVFNLSNGSGGLAQRVCVVDTRGELAAVNNGVPFNDVGPLTDVITGVSKAEGIEIAIRTMNPQIVAFDELGNEDDITALIDCMNSGVKVITTIHANSVEQLLKRRIAQQTLKTEAFNTIVLLKNIGCEPTIMKVNLTNSNFSVVPIETRCSV